MAQLSFYRYTDDLEAAIIRTEGQIAPAHGGTCKWYTPNRFESGEEARKYLALSYTPTHRIGPFPQDELPDFDHASLRLVAPNFDQAGGALEAAATQPFYLFAITPLPVTLP